MISDFDTQAPARNGQDAGHVQSRLEVAGRRTQEFSLPAPYRGYKFVAWINYPGRYAQDIGGNDNGLRLAAFAQIILSHNGWPDPETGEALPQWRTGDEVDVERFREFWEAIPQELALAVQAHIGSEVSNVAASVQERRRR